MVYVLPCSSLPFVTTVPFKLTSKLLIVALLYTVVKAFSVLLIFTLSYSKFLCTIFLSFSTNCSSYIFTLLSETSSWFLFIFILISFSSLLSCSSIAKIFKLYTPSFKEEISLLYSNLVLYVFSLNSNSFNLACPTLLLSIYTYANFIFEIDSISPSIFNSLSSITPSCIGAFKLILILDAACTFIGNINNSIIKKIKMIFKAK